MCARYTLFSSGHLLAERFLLPQVPDLRPRYNVAPTQSIAVVGAKAGGGRGLAMFHWGFVPHWANDLSGPKPVNAKAETIAEKVSFGDSFRQRRCLIPADGFYEWRTTSSGKKPVFFKLKEGKPLAFAGIWDFWKGGADKLFSCAIITTTPNALVAPIHNRMPVILAPDAWDKWLDPQLQDPAVVGALLRPSPAEDLEAIPIGTAVNNVRNEGPELLAPLAAE